MMKKSTAMNKTTGQIYYGAMGTTVYSKAAEASFASGNSGSLTEYWGETNAFSGSGSYTSAQPVVKIAKPFLKRFGEGNLMIKGTAKQTVQGGTTPVVTAHNSTIRATITDQHGQSAEGSDMFYGGPSNSGDTPFSITVDISGLTDNDVLMLKILCDPYLSVTNGDANTYFTKCHLKEDLVARTTT